MAKTPTLFTSPSRLPEPSRVRLAEALNARLADGIDLYTQIKVAHWNIKGAHFVHLHPFFDAVADDAAEANDSIAERLVVLGGRAFGTARHVAGASSLAEYPQETTRDLDHVRLLAERIEAYLVGVRAARAVADELGDDDTSDLLTGIARDFEKHGWFLRAMLEG